MKPIDVITRVVTRAVTDPAANLRVRADMSGVTVTVATWPAQQQALRALMLQGWDVTTRTRSGPYPLKVRGWSVRHLQHRRAALALAQERLSGVHATTAHLAIQAASRHLGEVPESTSAQLTSHALLAVERHLRWPQLLADICGLRRESEEPHVANLLATIKTAEGEVLALCLEHQHVAERAVAVYLRCLRHSGLSTGTAEQTALAEALLYHQALQRQPPAAAGSHLTLMNANEPARTLPAGAA
ncbi:hypothetical protein DQ384_38480 [Sphaerisporangium album]|uniref:Uncharacterized protein n=1 Tax=Sphaerisporangium album TaxID=509200 RepID=A0A367EM34_9ACTN|nr:hypothetical protein [Sphaerisporangium album]RCG19023.1 hypothetical protein DQ384_38480 [Sphaerisporangium album]